MHFIPSIKHFCVFALLFVSCRAGRTVAVAPNEEVTQTIAGAVSPNNYSAVSTLLPVDTNGTQPEVTLPENGQKELPEAASVAGTIQKDKKKITSFAQMKEMARSGELHMSKKDQKTLNRLEKHYKGDYQKFKADAFELTDKAKIIGGIGLLGLLLAIITGSAFGWFLFVVAALAFLLRYLDIIAF